MESSENPSSPDGEIRPEAPGEAAECLPCRGTGTVISNLGGEPKPLACPWCEGSGHRIAGIDAQAHWGSADGEPAAAGESASA